MLKFLGGMVSGIVGFALIGWYMAADLMVTIHDSPFSVEETAARLQQNMQKQGWDLSGLRNPQRAVKAKGASVPPVLLVEACNTDYSKPLLQDDDTRFVSIMMPCTITVYETSDGKTKIGTMNSGLMGWMFGPKVGKVMGKVADDQKKFLEFDPSQPAPKLIQGGPGGGGGKGAKPNAGC
ncbi:MAG: DUF302 domain-containing protein, partial [Rhodospirillales bacterium]|nr:DUF302 domain-containing protein [Rhodospirillales bacterium]MCW9039904.1 DUF302 domain-containing protein [Rhodospirillales bacterium]